MGPQDGMLIWLFIISRLILAISIGGIAFIQWRIGRTKEALTRRAYLRSCLLLGICAVAFAAGVLAALTKGYWLWAIVQSIAALVAVSAFVWWIKNYRAMNARDYEKVSGSQELLKRKLQMLRAKYPNEEWTSDLEVVETEVAKLFDVMAEAGLWIDSFRLPPMEATDSPN